MKERKQATFVEEQQALERMGAPPAAVAGSTGIVDEVRREGGKCEARCFGR